MQFITGYAQNRFSVLLLLNNKMHFDDCREESDFTFFQWGGDVTQLVERRTGTIQYNTIQYHQRDAAEAPLNPRCYTAIFLPQSTFSADSLTVAVHPRVQPPALTSVRTLRSSYTCQEFRGLCKH